MTKTNGQLLAEMAYPGTLSRYVTQRREAGDSWRTIGYDVNLHMNGGIKVTHQSLFNWYAGSDA